MITIGAGSVRRAAVVRTILLTTLLLGAVPAYAATVTGTKTVAGSFYPGGTVVYTVTLSNQIGPEQENNAGNEFTDILPASLALVGASASSGTAAANVGTNTVTWNGNVTSGGSVTITITATIVTGTAAGTVVGNQGTALYDSDGNGTNETPALTDDPVLVGAANPTTFTVIPAVTLTATKSVSGTFYRGGTVTYTIILTNTGPGVQPDNATDEFVDALPAGLSGTGSTASSGTMAAGGPNIATWNGSLASGASVTITLTATIDSATAAGTVVANQGTANYDADANGTNESNRLTDDTSVGGATDPTSFTVVNAATLTATKSVVGPFFPGTIITYTIVLTNTGAAAQPNNPGDEFTDQLPAGLLGIESSATTGTTAAGGANLVTWNGSIPPAGTVTITIAARILATTAPGTVVTNQGMAFFDADNSGNNESNVLTDDAGVGGATDPTSFTVVTPTLTATKSVTGPFNTGGIITYTIVLTNNALFAQPDNIGNEFVDALPAGLTGTGASATSGTMAAGGLNIATWNGAVPSGGSVTITINARIDAAVGAVVANQGTANFDGDNNGSNESSVLTDDTSVGGTADPTTFTVAPSVTITGTKTVSGTFTPGGAIVYTVVLSNAGPGAQLDNPTDEFVDVLPASLNLVSATASSGTAVATVGTRTVTWNGGVAASATVTITINATIAASTAPGVVSNQGTASFDADADGTNDATALTDDPGVAGAADATTFSVISPSTVTSTKTVSGPFYPGGPITYTVVLTNVGSSSQLNNPTDEFTDVLPASLTLISASASSGTAVATIGTNTVAWNGSLAIKSSATITINATIAALTPLGTVVTNQGTANFDADGNGTNEATALTDDPGVGGGADPTSFTVISPATVTGTKTVTGTFNPGGTITYTVVLTNSGPATQTNNPGDEFTDFLPASLTLVSANASSGTAVATVGTNSVTWNGSLANGASVTIAITATIAASTATGTVVTNQGAASFDADGDGVNEAGSPTDDPSTATPADATSFTVTSPATVTSTKTVTGTFNPGGTITYTVVVSNAGPSTQADNPGPEFTDVLPAGLTLVSANASSGTAVATIGTNTVTWDVALPNGASATIAITATIAASTATGTVVTNQGTASFDADGNGTNESTSLTDDPGVAGASNPTSFSVATPSTVTGTKTVTGTFSPGGAVSYTIVLSNAGPSAQADNPGPELTDVLPASLTLVSATASSGTAVATVGTRTVTWDGSLANGASATITIAATIAASTAPGTPVANQGTVSFDTDGNGTNESTTLTDDPGVPGAADPTTFTTTTEPTLLATKTVAGRFTAGGAITYTLVVSNTGALTYADQAGDELTDVLPASLTLVSASATGGTVVSTTATNTVTWNGSFAAGGAVTITIDATIAAATAPGTAVTNQGTIRFDADDNGTNESTVLTDDPNTPTAGDATRFTVVTPVPFIDLNGDGLGDVLLYNVATGGGASQVNDGSGGFTATAHTWDAGWKVFPLNLNDDALTDIFFYHPVNGFWVQALNIGDGTFSYTVGTWDPAWTVHPADLDGDAITDLFLYNASTGVWVKSFVDGLGGFANYTAGTWDPTWTFTPADLNGDGRTDFFLYNPETGVWVKAVSQEGTGTFDYPASGQWDLGWQLHPADLDGNDLTDLVLYNKAGVHVSALSRADGDFDYPVAGQWAPGLTIVPADFDGDGRTDLFLYDAATGMWQEAASDGAGDFTYASGQWDAGWTVGVTDLNADGHADILVSNNAGVWVQATNTGSGTFTYTVGNWTAGSTVFSQPEPVR